MCTVTLRQSTDEEQAPSVGYTRKIHNLLSAALQATQWQQRGFRVVITNGCFDIIHHGHVKYLQDARKLGDRLIVGVNSDRAVKLLKGPTRPINCQDDRMSVIAAFESVDIVTLVDDTKMCDFIEIIKPDVWAKGGDYTLETLDRSEVSKARQVHAEIALLKLVQGVSTTGVIAAINGATQEKRSSQRSRRK